MTETTHTIIDEIQNQLRTETAFNYNDFQIKYDFFNNFLKKFKQFKQDQYLIIFDNISPIY